MQREIGNMLVSSLAPAERKAFEAFRSFVGAVDDCAAAASLTENFGAGLAEGVQEFAAWMHQRDLAPDSQRAALEAVEAVTREAERLGLIEKSIAAADFAPRHFQSAPRRLQRNGGDRRSKQIQPCDVTIPGGTSAYFVARLARDRPDLLAELRRGAIPSVRQAAIRAGWVKPRGVR
jgi:hypothetical protein